MEAARGGAIRWARNRSRERLGGFLVGSVVFGLATGLGQVLFGPIPDDANLFTRAIPVGAGAVVGLAIAVPLAFLWSFLRAPYEQRDALAADALLDAPGLPDLEITAWRRGTSYFTVTNNGPTDSFQATIEPTGEPDYRRYMNWSPKFEEFEQERKLPSGAHGVASGWPGNARRATVRFLSDTNEPLSIDYQIRTTRLGLHQIKRVGESWPKCGEEWRAKIDELIEQVEEAITQYDRLQPWNKSAANDIMKTLLDSFSNADVLGGTLSSRYYQADRRLSPGRPTASRASDPEYVAAWRAALDEMLADLRDVRERGDDYEISL
jgi:hypothetical protein